MIMTIQRTKTRLFYRGERRITVFQMTGKKREVLTGLRLPSRMTMTRS